MAVFLNSTLGDWKIWLYLFKSIVIFLTHMSSLFYWMTVAWWYTVRWFKLEQNSNSYIVKWDQLMHDYQRDSWHIMYKIQWRLIYIMQTDNKCNYVFCLLLITIRRPPSLSELTPMIFNTGLITIAVYLTET